MTIGKRYTENLEAYQDFLRGRYRLNKLTLEDMKKKRLMMLDEISGMLNSA